MRADVQKIFKKTPCDKQVMMFSATLPEDTKVVCKKFMRKPVEIIVKEENKEHLEKLQQFYVKLKEEIKGDLACLVLCHTRELAYQISKEFLRFCKGFTEEINKNMKTCLLIGGDNEKEQVKALKSNPKIIIGTPGRILALTKRNALNLNNIQVFVIDECDKMLNALGKFKYLINILKNNILSVFRYES